MQFVFSVRQPLDEDTAMTLQPEEIAATHWVDRDQVVDLHGGAGRSRMAAALEALSNAVPIYLET